MLSRVADSIYWMCRYIERAENIARFVNVNSRLMLDMPAESQAPQWLPLIQITADTEMFAERYEEPSRDNVIHFLSFDSEYPNSVLSCLAAARENARTVREIIPTDIWEHVNTFYLTVKEASARYGHGEAPIEFFQDIVKQSYAFIGMTMTTMTHNDGWHFCRVGRMLERADKTSRILDVKYFYLLPTLNDVGSAIDNIQWSALLRSASALQMYRQKYGRISPSNVIEHLLLDDEFPRSVRYCTGRVQDSLHSISGTRIGTFGNEAERHCGMLYSELSYTKVDDIVRSGLHEFLDSCQIKFNNIGNAVYETFFEIRPVHPAQGMRQEQRQ